MSMLIYDLQKLGQEEIPISIPEYKLVFGEESITFLEFISKRVEYFSANEHLRSLYANYSRNNIGLFGIEVRRAKSISLDPIFFDGSSVERRATIVHEAYHHDYRFLLGKSHVNCTSPSRLKSKKGCDKKLLSPYGADFLYSVLTSSIEESYFLNTAIKTVRDIAINLNRIIDANDRKKLVKLFQSQLQTLHFGIKYGLLSCNLPLDEGEKGPDISELFAQ